MGYRHLHVLMLGIFIGREGGADGVQTVLKPTCSVVASLWCSWYMFVGDRCGVGL